SSDSEQEQPDRAHAAQQDQAEGQDHYGAIAWHVASLLDVLADAPEPMQRPAHEQDAEHDQTGSHVPGVAEEESGVAWQQLPVLQEVDAEPVEGDAEADQRDRG